MKKYILTLILVFVSVLSINAKNINAVEKIDSAISEVVINIPSTVKVFPSTDNNTYIRLRSRKNNILSNVQYKLDKNTLFFYTNGGLINLNSLNSNDIIIYLYVNSDDIKYNTHNHDLFISTTKCTTHKKTNKTNHEDNN